MPLPKRAVSALAALVIPAALAVSVPSSASAATNKYFALNASAACGRIAPNRALSESTVGTLSASSSLFTWTFKVLDTFSTVGWNACGAAAPYGSYPVAATSLSQTFTFRVTSPVITSCSVGTGGTSCSSGVGSKAIIGRQSGTKVGQLQHYMNGGKITSTYPARFSASVSASVVQGAYGGTVTSSTAAWAI